jgi:FdhD protein
MSGSKLYKNELEPKFIFNLQEIMQSNQPIFTVTGSTHGSALFNKKGDLLSLKEDIGRHNALDKAIGDLIRQKRLKEAKILFFSGRLSFEIIFKSFRSKIPTIIAISAPSSLAIDYAKEFGITLYGFCRGDRFTRYS